MYGKTIWFKFWDNYSEFLGTVILDFLSFRLAIGTSGLANQPDAENIIVAER